MRLKDRDPQAFRLQSKAIKAEVKNLIEKKTFCTKSVPDKGVPVIPTTLINKVKLLSDGSWDKAKSSLCVRGDIQRYHSEEETWSAASAKRTVRTYVANAAHHNAVIWQLDFVGAYLQP